MARWEDAEDLLREMALIDLERGEHVNPCLVAFAGDEGLLVAFVRSFDRGRYHGPLSELFTLVGPLGADRLAVSLTGRAWSLEDPIVPACPDGDLRQRVLTLHFADAAGSAPDGHSVLRPFDLVDGVVVWGERVRMPPAQGWISQALALAAGGAWVGNGASQDPRRQLRRCAELGHVLYPTPAMFERLTMTAEPGRR